MAMIYFSMQPTPSLEKVSSYGLLPDLYIFLLVEYKNVSLNLSSVFMLYT